MKLQAENKSKIITLDKIITNVNVKLIVIETLMTNHLRHHEIFTKWLIALLTISVTTSFGIATAVVVKMLF